MFLKNDFREIIFVKFKKIFFKIFFKILLRNLKNIFFFIIPKIFLKIFSKNFKECTNIFGNYYIPKFKKSLEIFFQNFLIISRIFYK